MFKNLKMGAKITLVVSLVLILGLGSVMLITINSLRSTTYKDTENRLGELCNARAMYVKAYIDEFCNYLAVEFYVGCTDWPQNNLKAFRPIQENGRFRFILYDLDHSFNTSGPFSLFAGKSTYRFNTLYGEPVSNYTKEI